MTAATDLPAAVVPVTAGPGASARIWSGLAGLWPSVLLGLATLTVWELASRLFNLPAFVLPPPSSIVQVLVTHQRDLAAATIVTAQEVFFGFVFSALAGAAVALVVARFERFGGALYPLIVLFQTVPKIALAPLFILWFGYDLLPKILLIVVIAFFPVALNMLVGLRSADPNLVALLRSVGATRTEVLIRVQIPNSLPYLMAGLKVAVTLAVIGAIVGEFAGAQAGLGYMIQFASTQMETALVFAVLVQVSVLGVLFYYVIELIEWRYVNWVPQTG